MAEVVYKYIGSGLYVPGVPARDLTEEEAERYGVTEGVVYERVEASGKKRAKDEETG